MRPSYKKILVSPDHSFRCFERREPTIAFDWHCHPQAELTMIVHGRGRRLVGDHTGEYADGDLSLLGPNLPHTYVSRGSPKKGRMQHAVVLHFAPDFLGERFFELPEMRRVKDLLRRSAQGLAFFGAPRRRVLPMIRAMPRQSAADRLVGLVAILNILAQSRAAEARPLTSKAFTTPVRPAVLRRINTVCRHIDEHSASPLQRDRLAALAGMTPSAFSRFFHKATTKTLTDYVNEVRVGHACQMLTDSDSTVAAIGLRCGFNNLSNFNRRFKRTKGVTPSEYRGQHREP